MLGDMYSEATCCTCRVCIYWCVDCTVTVKVWLRYWLLRRMDTVMRYGCYLMLAEMLVRWTLMVMMLWDMHRNQAVNDAVCLLTTTLVCLSIDSAPSLRVYRLFFVVDSVCLFVTNIGSSFFVSQWNRAIFGHQFSMKKIQNCFLRFLI